MRKSFRSFFILTVTALLILGAAFSVYASYPERETDVTAASDGCVMVACDGKFSYTSKETILAYINKIRLEACRQGVPDPRNPSRKLVESDYVPIKWSYDLEWIAQTRAAEASVFEEQAHWRPNGEACFSLVHNNITSEGENLAWAWPPYSNPNIEGIDSWYEEKEDWVNQTPGAVTGHYTSMIDPGFLYVGIGSFTPDADDCSATAGEFSFVEGLDESQEQKLGARRQLMEVAVENLTADVEAKANPIRVGQSSSATIETYAVKLLSGMGQWESSNPDILTIDNEGVYKGVSPGTATISTTIGGKVYSCDVIVKAASPKVIVDRPAVTIMKPKAAKKAATVYWKKISVKNRKKIDGIEIQYCRNKAFKSGVKTVKVGKTKAYKKITKLKSRKTYYIRIRTYKKINGTMHVSKWSVKKAVKTK